MPVLFCIYASLSAFCIRIIAFWTSPSHCSIARNDAMKPIFGDTIGLTLRIVAIAASSDMRLRDINQAAHSAADLEIP